MNRHPYHLERIGYRKTAADEARDEYRKAIREAHADGWSTREIAEAAGISHSRVYQIVKDNRQETP